MPFRSFPMIQVELAMCSRPSAMSSSTSVDEYINALKRFLFAHHGTCKLNVIGNQVPYPPAIKTATRLKFKAFLSSHAHAFVVFQSPGKQEWVVTLAEEAGLEVEEAGLELEEAGLELHADEAAQERDGALPLDAGPHLESAGTLLEGTLEGTAEDEDEDETILASPCGHVFLWLTQNEDFLDDYQRLPV